MASKSARRARRKAIGASESTRNKGPSAPTPSQKRQELFPCIVCICKAEFRSDAWLANHRHENILSCEVCAVHLPPGVSLQDHWRQSGDRHPYCTTCDTGFEDGRSWRMHTRDCPLATGNPALALEEAGPGEIGNDLRADWYLSGLLEAFLKPRQIVRRIRGAIVSRRWLRGVQSV
ncbi:hypothetical protein C8Q77DRAFT_499914 [Trametes polyzona]|nr:hypothetical protein C8Q77DRAFT_499914 [Trametes polyzona]